MRCQNPTLIELPESDDSELVPCGKCLICLQNKRNEWSFRLEQEWKVAKSAAFLTLTYNDQYLPDGGVQKRHLQLFLKRLRKREPKSNIRYYAVGEYGSKTNRPHYHILLFNYENIQNVSRSWALKWKGNTRSIGLVHIGTVTQASIRYCTKYVIQRNQCWPKNSEKPFALMSRAYGIGGHYLTDSMVAWHRSGLKNYCLYYGEKCRLPKFYKDKIFYNEDQKRLIRDESKKNAALAEAENYRIIQQAGYVDPDKIQKEMRDALLSRVREKIAYTQKF